MREVVGRSWIEPLTGHRVTRLSEEPGTTSLYFHQNAFPRGGDVVVVQTPERGLATIELATGRTRRLGGDPVRSPVVAARTREVFHVAPDAVLASEVDRGTTRVVARLPRGWQVLARPGDEALLSVSADGRVVVGVAVTGPVPTEVPADIAARWGLRLPYALFASDETGAVSELVRGDDWLNHPQIAPGDRPRVLYCHEGPWHLVDRIWTIELGERVPRLVRAREREGEIAGHEVWGPEGRVVWFDLQTPRGERFWLAGHDVTSGARVRHPLSPEGWSLHTHPLRDGRFVGDGSGPAGLARERRGAWLSLLTPRGGGLEVRRLVDLERHDYRLEPNPQPTPDGRSVVFRANIEGAPHVYAVELEARRPVPRVVASGVQRLRAHRRRGVTAG